MAMISMLPVVTSAFTGLRWTGFCEFCQLLKPRLYIRWISYKYTDITSQHSTINLDEGTG